MSWTSCSSTAKPGKPCQGRTICIPYVSSPDYFRRGAVTLLHAFCEQSKTDYSEYVPQLLRSLLLLFTDSEPGVLTEAWAGLAAVTKTLDPAMQMSCVSDVRQAVR